MKFKRKKVRLLSPNYMDRIPSIPSDHPWYENENGIIEITMPHTGFYARIACKYFKKPESSCISLDKYGTTVWKNINGKNTIYDIVRIMQQTFPNDNSNMLKRVITFMTILETNKFIVFS